MRERTCNVARTSPFFAGRVGKRTGFGIHNER